MERGLPPILKHAAGHEARSPTEARKLRESDLFRHPRPLTVGVKATSSGSAAVCSRRAGGSAGILVTCALPPQGDAGSPLSFCVGGVGSL